MNIILNNYQKAPSWIKPNTLANLQTEALLYENAEDTLEGFGRRADILLTPMLRKNIFQINGLNCTKCLIVDMQVPHEKSISNEMEFVVILVFGKIFLTRWSNIIS